MSQKVQVKELTSCCLLAGSRSHEHSFIVFPFRAPWGHASPTQTQFHPAATPHSGSVASFTLWRHKRRTPATRGAPRSSNMSPPLFFIFLCFLSLSFWFTLCTVKSGRYVGRGHEALGLCRLCILINLDSSNHLFQDHGESCHFRCGPGASL